MSFLSTFHPIASSHGGLEYVATFKDGSLQHDARRILEKNHVQHQLSDNAPYTITIPASEKEKLANNSLFRFSLVTFTSIEDNQYKAKFDSEAERDSFVGFLEENHIHGTPGHTEPLRIGRRNFPAQYFVTVPAGHATKLHNIEWIGFADRSLVTVRSEQDISPTSSAGVLERIRQRRETAEPTQRD